MPREAAWRCAGCGQDYPEVAGIPDLRLHSDGYLSLAGDRAKALMLARAQGPQNFARMAQTYYEATSDVDALRRDAYLRHLERAYGRGAALLSLLPRRGRILEIGCGSGGLVAAAAAQGRTIMGVDIALRWLVLARRRLADRGLTAPLVAASADGLPWPPASFDTIVADSVLEHLPDPQTALREWARVLRPGGKLLIWSPNRFSLLPDPHVGLWGLGWLPERWAQERVRKHRDCDWTVRPLDAWQACRMVRRAGFETIRVEPVRATEGLIPRTGRGGRIATRVYNAARVVGPSRLLLLGLGPLWQLSATRGGTP